MEQFLAILRRAFLLEEDAWTELRDGVSYTAIIGGLAALVVLLAGLGAFLWGEFNLNSTPDGWFVDTVILGTIFTLLLLLAWVAVTYIVLTQVFRETVAPDALFRVFAVGVVPWAIGFLVFIPELNFVLASLSIALMLFLIMFGRRRAFAIERVRVLLATLAGFAVFVTAMSLLITVDNSFVTGAFVFETSEDAVTKSYGSSDIDFDFDNLDGTTPGE